jgi:hypothetical protein
MYESINQPIHVAAVFKGGKAVPLKFLWNGREYPVAKVNLSYSQFEGRAKIYYFAVSDQANYFKLRFNSDDLGWTLVETYAGGGA